MGYWRCFTIHNRKRILRIKRRTQKEIEELNKLIGESYNRIKILENNQYKKHISDKGKFIYIVKTPDNKNIEFENENDILKI